MIRVIYAAIFPIIFIICWEAAVNFYNISEIVIPAPSGVANALVENSNRIFLSLVDTMVGAFLGLALGIIIAISIATAFILSTPIKTIFYPWAIAIKATPLIALAPLVNLWFGEGLSSKVVMSALLAFFPLLVSIYDGMFRIPSEFDDLSKSLSATRWQRFIYIQAPNALPEFFSSLKIAAPVSVVGAVIGEYTGSSSGIGHLIIIESYYLNTDVIFAAITTLAAASLAVFLAVSYLEKTIKYW